MMMMMVMVSLSLVLVSSSLFLDSWTIRGAEPEPVQKDKIARNSRRRAKVARRVSKSCQSRRGLGRQAGPKQGSGQPGQRFVRLGKWQATDGQAGSLVVVLGLARGAGCCEWPETPGAGGGAWRDVYQVWGKRGRRGLRGLRGWWGALGPFLLPSVVPSRLTLGSVSVLSWKTACP